LKNFAIGKTMATNQLRNLAKDVYGDVVPNNWRKYVVNITSLNDWVLDFKKRLDQFVNLS